MSTTKKIYVVLIALVGMICYSVSCFSQNAKLVNGNYVSVSKERTPAKPTGKTFTDSKGIKYPVMLTATGKLFVLKTSAKTGKEYKMYLKL